MFNVKSDGQVGNNSKFIKPLWFFKHSRKFSLHELYAIARNKLLFIVLHRDWVFSIFDFPK